MAVKKTKIAQRPTIALHGYDNKTPNVWNQALKSSPGMFLNQIL